MKKLYSQELTVNSKIFKTSLMAIENTHAGNKFAQMHNDIKELKRVVKQLATAANIENTITIDE